MERLDFGVSEMFLKRLKSNLSWCFFELRYDGLELDLKIIWNCNADIVVDVQGIEIGIENVRIDGPLVLILFSFCHSCRWFVSFICIYI